MIHRKILAGGVAFLAVVALCMPRPLRAQDDESNAAPASANSDKAVEQDSGKEVLHDSGKDVVTDASKEGSSNLGTGNFSRSPFRVSLSVREGYDDNVYTTKQDKVGSFFTNGTVLVDYKFGSPRTTFDLQALAGASYYYYRPFGQQYDINTSLTLGLDHHFTPRLALSASAYLTYQTEPDFNTAFGINRRAGNYFYTVDKLALSYQWAPRFSTVTSYTFGAINYDDSSIGAFEDRFEHTFGNEFRFLVLPTTTLVAEYRFEIIDFDEAIRDSTTHFVLGGLDHTFNPRFNVSLRAGAEFRDFDNFGERTSPYAEATLRYALGERTSISWLNRYGLEEPDVPGTQSRTTFRSGLTVAYGIAPRITLSGAVFYQHDDNDAVVAPTFIIPFFAEDSLDIGLGLRYDINRVFAVLAGYSHTEVFSDIALREYARNRYYLGLNATF